MNQDRLEYLLERHRQNQCSEAEMSELNEWFHRQNPGGEEMDRLLQEIGGGDELSANLYNDFKGRLPGSSKIITLGRAVRVAAVVLILAASGLWFYARQYPDTNFNAGLHNPQKNLIKPGGNKAVLVLANGSKIILNNAVNGNLAMQNAVRINKTAAGNISYQGSKKNLASGQLVYNTLTTPRGGNYVLTLIDGTQVTLDAESSITYPVAFNGGERKVYVTSGQAYFQVVHNAAVPFRVVVKGQTIEDVGTAFNINAYDDDPSIKITVAEGQVKVSNPYKTLGLLPGQQAEVMREKQNMTLKSVDVEETVAWKTGWFTFHNKPVKDVMKQASRWYDVDVVYEKDAGTRRFGGSISKYKSIEALMESLKITGKINYKIEGRRVTLMN